MAAFATAGNANMALNPTITPTRLAISAPKPVFVALRIAIDALKGAFFTTKIPLFCESGAIFYSKIAVSAFRTGFLSSILSSVEMAREFDPKTRPQCY